MTAPTTSTDGIDFAALLAHCRDAMHDAMEFPSYIDVDVLLAAKVSEARPESTIGQMLREWQALTALVEYATHHDWNCPRPSRADCACGLDAARAALEAVRGD